MERLGHLGLVERLSGDTVVETVEERIKEQVIYFGSGYVFISPLLSGSD